MWVRGVDCLVGWETLFGILNGGIGGRLLSFIRSLLVFAKLGVWSIRFALQ